VELNHCLFKNLFQNSIYGENGNLKIIDCNVQSTYGANFPYGIGIYSNYCNLLLERNRIHHNSLDGLYIFSNYQAAIINNWIYSNADSGIYMWSPKSDYLIRNNTIYGNTSNGIERGVGSNPQILNCIIWDNGDDLVNCSATFSCIKDGDSGDHNIYTDPCFMNIETNPNDFHISAVSPCKDKGDANDIPSGETDIDGEARIMYGKVDMGADEYYWSPADFDLSGLVDFIDYAILANVFRRCDTNVEKYNLDDNNCIDLADLDLFCDDWLWEPSWESGWMMAMGGGGEGLRGGLMFDTEQSLVARPQKLADRSDKFYSVNVNASKTAAEITPLDIDEDFISEVLDWLDKTWLESDEFGEYMTEEEHLEFRKLVEEDLLIFLKGD